jgi:broad specificity phosphatase PhoE
LSLFVSDFLCIDERLKRLQESLKKQGFEQVPSEIQRAQETLTLIFKQFELDPIADKALYDTLIDWKRTL